MNRTLLVLEDDEQMAEMLEFVFENTFDEIVTCTTQEDAIHQAREFLSDLDPQEWPDVFLVDMLINGESGIDFYEWMQDQNDGSLPDHSSMLWLTGCHPKSVEFRKLKQTDEEILEKEDFSSERVLEEVQSMVEDPTS